MKDSMEEAGAHGAQRSFPPVGREDCWSEGATSSLIEAWGDRHLHLSRGNLRQSDWKDVADAVNRRQAAAGKPRKTDIQCKNRIDTLKKKYKLEKSKPAPSRWIFFHRLDYLIGTAAAPASKKPPPPNPPHLIKSITLRSPNHDDNSNNHSSDFNSNQHNNHVGDTYGAASTSKSVTPQGSTESSRGCGSGGDQNHTRSGGVTSRKHKREEDFAFSELARAVVKFGEIYERIETAKQQQMMELERQRMEFTKDLEFQRMQMFMEGQLELEKMKRPKHTSGSGKKL